MTSRHKNLPGRVEVFSRLAVEAGEHGAIPLKRDGSKKVHKWSSSLDEWNDSRKDYLRSRSLKKEPQTKDHNVL